MNNFVFMINTDDKILIDIGKRFKLLRIKKGYTSHETFAVDNKLPRMQYWRIEKGVSNLTIKSINQVLHIHQLTIEEFFMIEV